MTMRDFYDVDDLKQSLKNYRESYFDYIRYIRLLKLCFAGYAFSVLGFFVFLFLILFSFMSYNCWILLFSIIMLWFFTFCFRVSSERLLYYQEVFKDCEAEIISRCIWN